MTIQRRAPAACTAVVLLVFLFSSAAAAQTGPAGHEWSHGTMLSVFGGAAHGGSHTGALAGGGIGWEVLPWFGLEGSGAWLDRGDGAEAFTADFKTMIGLPRAGVLAPFVAGGVGLYRVSYDRVRSAIPMFYMRRMGVMGPMNAGVRFTDPSVIVGGGLNVFVTTHAALRPEVTSTIVLGDGRTHVVTAVALRATYHFEDHPITPERTRR